MPAKESYKPNTDWSVRRLFASAGLGLSSIAIVNCFLTQTPLDVTQILAQSAFGSSALCSGGYLYIELLTQKRSRINSAVRQNKYVDDWSANLASIALVMVGLGLTFTLAHSFGGAWSTALLFFVGFGMIVLLMLGKITRVVDAAQNIVDTEAKETAERKSRAKGTTMNAGSKVQSTTIQKLSRHSSKQKSI